MISGQDLAVAGRFVQLSRRVALLPIVLFGLIVVAAGLVFGHPGFALAAALLSVLVSLSLRADTRVDRALAQLLKGDHEAAATSLEAIVSAPRGRGEGKTRALEHLASLAWHRGEVERALDWTRRRQAEGASARCDGPLHRWRVEMTRIQLLAMSGAGVPAADALVALGGPPGGGEGDVDRVTLMHSRLLAGLGSGGIEVERGELETWGLLCERSPSRAFSYGLLGWAWEEQGELLRARQALQEARSCPEWGALVVAFPLLGSWADRLEGRCRRVYPRG